MSTEIKQENKLKPMVENFDRFLEYLEPKMERDIEEHRKGQFVVKFRDAEGNPLENVSVKVRQKKHEFKFGCSIFHLGQFPDAERNTLYADRFRELFNYAIVPLYWDTLEPEEGKPRFGKDSVPISRRPPIDTIMEFCDENGISTKGHCLAYNSFQPDWLPDSNREIKIKLDERMRAIAERYGNRIPDFDVINEMISIYKNCYPGHGMRNFCVNLARRHFPHGRLFWNEGGNETFGTQHDRGYRSFYYMTIEKMLRDGVPIEGIGMQYHMFAPRPDMANPLRIIDGNVLTGAKTTAESFLGAFSTEITVIPEILDDAELLGWIAPRPSMFSTSRSYFSWLFPNRQYTMDARIKGGERHMIMSGEYDKVFPMDI